MLRITEGGKGRACELTPSTKGFIFLISRIPLGTEEGSKNRFEHYVLHIHGDGQVGFVMLPER
jgi:hypothetical protein